MKSEITDIHLHAFSQFSVMALIVSNALRYWHLLPEQSLHISHQESLPGYSLHSGADMGAMLAVLES